MKVTKRTAGDLLRLSFVLWQVCGSLALSSSTTTSTPTQASPFLASDYVKTDAIVCGAGPAGLLSAIMLVQKYPQTKVQVFDRLLEPPSPTDETVWGDFAKFYLIGLGGRGQTSLDRFGVWKDVEAVCTAVPGRKDWAPETPDEAVERIFTERKFTTQVLPRDKLVAVLHKHIVNKYSEKIQLNYGSEIRPVHLGDDDHNSAFVEVFPCVGESEEDLSCEVDSVQRLSTNLLIAADGTARTIASEMEKADTDLYRNMNPIRRLFAGKPFKVTRYVDDNQRIYKTIPIKVPKDWRADLNYSARSKGGRVNLDALPANNKGEYCGVFLVKKDDDFAQPNVDPVQFRAYLETDLPMFSEIIDDKTLEEVAMKPPSFLPGFRYSGPRLHQGAHTVLLGDAIHTVKPYFGLGANSALEDVKILSDCLDETASTKEAVLEYSRRRGKDSERLVKISRSLDRPGTIGTITFVIPIILDAIFNKMAPNIFAPNIISMLQNPDLTFVRAGRRKRLDRALQLSIISTGISGAAVASKLAITTLAKAFGRRSSTVTGAMVGALVGASLLRSCAPFLVKGIAPADVVAKSKSSITKNDSITRSKK